MKVYRCKHCQALHSVRVSRCRECDYPGFREVFISVSQYCEHFGHDGGWRKVPGTRIFLGTRFEPLEEDGCVVGGSTVNVYSDAYEFKCARCGFKTFKRQKN